MSDEAEKRSGCPISCALDIMGDKWSLLVLRDLIFMKKRYFKEFLSSSEGIATNILSDRLKRLEGEGLILKQQDPENKRQMIYSLTEKGLALTPVLVELVYWGAKHDPRTQMPPEFIQKIEDDRQGFINKYMELGKKAWTYL